MASISEDDLEEPATREAPTRDVTASPELTGPQRQHLKRLAHALEPVIQVGHKGVTETLTREVDQALLAHELIKVKLGRHVPGETDAVLETLVRSTGAAVVQTIGKVVVLFRPHPEPERQKIELPA